MTEESSMDRMPQREPVEVLDEGFTMLSDPSEPVADIVFIHGLQGHPQRTWTYGKTSSKPSKNRSKVSKLFRAKPSSSDTTDKKSLNDTTDKKSCFWPEELLSKDFPNCRIVTYGYDSHISNFFGGPANQTTIIGHGRSLLHALEALRRSSSWRPIIFIVHSLGGLVLKEALRRSWQAQHYEADLRTIYDSTAAIIFMGTPHRGSQHAEWGLLARNIAVAVGFDASDRVLRDLKIDSGILDILRDDFSKMLREESFDVYTFMEGKGLRGVRGLSGKVVPDISSGLDNARERKDIINANHMDMCRFRGAEDPGYRKVKDVVSRCLDDSLTSQGQGKRFLYSPEGKAVLESLNSPETRLRFEQVDEACENTFEWLFEKTELGFLEWLRDGRGLYWIKGKPASGKSTLMRFAYNDPRTVDALEEGVGRKARAAFFFHDRGSHIQKSFEGLLKGVLHQILDDIPELLRVVVPLSPIQFNTSHSRTNAVSSEVQSNGWTVDRLTKVFDAILQEKILDADICLFLDALDEYSGNHEEIADFLHEIVQKSPFARAKLKICFSSRPLQIFLDKFDVPGFWVQEHTGDDINVVIKTRMKRNPRMLRHMHSTSAEDRQATAELSAEIASRAEGVFLWVRLVLDELLEEFTDGCSIQQLYERLLILPTDLEDYYQRIFNRIPQRYREEAFVMFEIVNRAYHPVIAWDFFQACKFAPIDNIMQCEPSAEPPLDQLERWVRSRSGGLIELRSLPGKDEEEEEEDDDVLSAQDGTASAMLQVQFIHQTVKAFLQKPGTRSMISSTPIGSNGYVFMLKFILTRITQSTLKRNKDSRPPWWLVWNIRLLAYAKLAETSTSNSQRIIWDHVPDERLAAFYDGVTRARVFKDSLFEDKISFAVAAGLHLYLAETCTTKVIRQARTIPLLHLALDEEFIEMLFYRDGSSDSLISSRIPTVRFLIERGASLDMLYKDETAFQTLCNWSDPKEDLWASLIEVFLEHGQDPDVDIPDDAEPEYRSKPLHRAAGLLDFAAITILLQHGAKVNPFDSNMHTPLDEATGCLGDRFYFFLSSHFPERYPRRAFDDTFAQSALESEIAHDIPKRLPVIMRLLDNGGKCGGHAPLEDGLYDSTVPVTTDDLRFLRELGLDVDDRVLDLPKLASGSHKRITGLVGTISRFVPFLGKG